MDTLASHFSLSRSAAAALGALVFLTACGKSEPEAAYIPSTMVAAVQTPKPDYPMELLCAGIGGVSTLKVLVGVEGKPVEVALIGSSGQSALDAAAQKAVPAWIFEPATRNGQPVSQSIQVPVKFTPPAERPNECFKLDEQR
ncbi:MAG: energy transducer TonB [Pseudoxanthomonas sp.]